MKKKPNILLIVCDDMGYSDLGCFGGEIDTPNLDRLALNGLRFINFCSSPRCAPSRASMMTGLHPHQTGIGILTYDDGPEGYPGNLNKQCITIAEALKASNYKSYLSGKWHMAKDTTQVNDTWPLQRGFDRFFGTLAGSGSFFFPHTLTRDNESAEHEVFRKDFYYTDAVTDNAIKFITEHVQNYPDTPFFQYAAYTAPHWPLQAPEEEIIKYKGRFDKGWDTLRAERIKRMTDTGILEPSCKLSERDPNVPSWNEADHKEWRLRCMEVYAAQITRMDAGIGKIIKTLEDNGQLDNTFIFFLSDNGGCNEVIKPHPEPGSNLLQKPHTRQGEPVILGNYTDVMPGPENTFQTYEYWANLSNTPFRLYKSWTHEGGITTPFIAYHPSQIADPGAIRRTPGQLTDIMATILEITGTEYPSNYNGYNILPLEGRSMLPAFEKDTSDNRCFFWEHQGNCAVKCGKWKLVKEYPKDWELYDLEKDRTESCDISAHHSEIVQELSEKYEQWAQRCGVIPRDTILSIRGRKLTQNPYFGWMI